MPVVTSCRANQSRMQSTGMESRSASRRLPARFPWRRYCFICRMNFAVAFVCTCSCCSLYCCDDETEEGSEDGCADEGEGEEGCDDGCDDGSATGWNCSSRWR